MKKINQKKGLSATVSMFMTLAVCQSVATQASDIDIYSSSTGGQTRIMFVLDTSASMKATNTFKFACDAPVADSLVTVPTNNTETSTTTPSYTRYYCMANTTVENLPKTYNYKAQTISALKTYKCQSNVTTATNCVGTEASLGPYECSEVSGNTTYYFNTSDSQNRCNRGTKTYVFKTETINTTNYYTCNSPYTQQGDCPTGTLLTSPPSGANTFLESANGFNYYGAPAQTTTQTEKYYDRITKLKDGLFTVLQGLNGVPQLGNDIVIGLTRFTGGTSGTSSKTGEVLVSARRLDTTSSSLTGTARTTFETECGTASNTTQRSCILQKIATMNAPDYTPTGRAYAIGARSLLNTIGTDTSSCNGNGVYVLTDGGPSTTSVADPETEMSATVSGFSCPSSWDTNVDSENSTYEFKSKTASPDNEKVWRCIAKFANTLLNGATNRPKIKTAVVGFGKFYSGLDAYTGAEKTKSGPLTSTNTDVANILNRFLSISNTYGETTGGASRADIANTALWGVYGRGGWYSASEPGEVAQSILNFVDEVKPEFDPVATGSPTLPQDALNPLRIQPYGYYASFIPKPQETTQLWAGNLNKYHIYNGELYNSSKTVRLITDTGALNSAADGIWSGGMKGKLSLGLSTNAENEKNANRTIYTNRQITGTAAPFMASELNSLKKVNVESLFGTGTTALFANDPDKNYWLNLLGYNVGATETDITLDSLTAKPELRQVGAVMHSTPILLTQRGKITVSSAGVLDTTDRDDYLLFGSTQGLLHVVDADTGIEKFAFAPHEMMQNQKVAFLSETSSTQGSSNLFYGIDAPWTAYTQYVSKADGTLTVKSSDRTSDGGTNTDLALKGLQWVYGGLRMGGRSYYALNLSDLDNPSLKFHINPAAAVTTDANGTTTPNTDNALSYMGQSWSKPTLAYVKFGGVKKLVMFVGGGYDTGYESAAYDQNTTTGSGAGVYMFDADTGSLLWWSSANATAAKGAEAFTDASASTINMKYSVVSQINAIDRDNDGLVDNLYFGDLGGQAFRVDLNNAATGVDASAKKANFATRVVRLFNEHASGGTSPRFYEMPSVSIHEDNGYVAAVAFSSGNRSSPLVGTAAASGTNNQAGSTVSAADGVFVVYDKDVAKTNLYATSPVPTLTTQNVTLASLNTNITTGVAITGNNGWKYTYSSTAGVYKGMNELYALDGMLYVNVYHRDGTGIGGSCGAGVKGDSYVYQFCLPTGKCSFATTTSGVPNRVKLGAGILGTGLGQGFRNANNTGLIVRRPATLNCTTTPNLPECQEFTTTAKLRQLRWYESR
ncbi:pilus assembly protein PilC [Acinetobacter sp. C_4_1]|uniref:pilus assembly protein PilC n=1 Tax=unclassified Acinetobacter TaxID=196816 RepID=UPI0021B787DA|nr:MULTISPECIES: pilus assembly protein PilC [unclassified Acinetobacter]MCT8089492.1 pilus assembly protein PilC [Acinetobacter sp. F_3_1]MCT8098140.1 pilus assembly protein PilC [Acinetobacter sp. C_3_1]MCT8101056.1 pilus assembly protein PilC [Acinetobacter sp. C_4_1]MCT8134807.1 pilus assembly protein PilC [Acinetobacter sp. T_3_1]